MLNPTKIIIECSGSFLVTPLQNGRVELLLENAEQKTAAASEDPLYDKAEVARRLGVTTRSIENWMNQKKHPLPFIRSCGRPKFRESDVQWWLSQGCSVASRRASTTAGGIIPNEQ